MFPHLQSGLPAATIVNNCLFPENRITTKGGLGVLPWPAIFVAAYIELRRLA